jgi:hypothetical protein
VQSQTHTQKNLHLAEYRIRTKLGLANEVYGQTAEEKPIYERGRNSPLK